MKQQTTNKGDNMKNEVGYKVMILGNKCYRCGHEWIPQNIEEKPKVCPKCKNPYWDRPRQEKKKNAKSN